LTTKKFVVSNLAPKVEIFLIWARLKFLFLKWHFRQDGHVTVLIEMWKDDFATPSVFSVGRILSGT
jgi:hypothetical protein